MDEAREFRARIRECRSMLTAQGLDALTVADEKNLRYLFGVETGRGVVTRNSCILWVRPLYLQAYSQLFAKAPYSAREYRKGSVEKYFKSASLKRVGFEDVSVSHFRSLKKRLGIKNPKVVDMVERMRSVKSPYELRLMRKSAAIACAGMMKASEVVREGVSELSAVAEVEAEIRRLGSESPPFEGGMILASGSNAADIHAHPTAKKISRGLVVVDLGARFRGYHSDMTRTLCVGRLTKKEELLVEAIGNIRDETIDYIKPGCKACDVHAFAEQKIKKLGHEFYHGVGHGVGLAIHELPSLLPESGDVLEGDMVFTIEPGVYVPKKYGVRFEDTILLKKTGVEKLTKT